MGRDLGIFAGCVRRFDIPLEDEFKMLKEAGFTCYDIGNLYSAYDVVELGDKIGLKIESLHGPFMPAGLYCNDVWKPGINGDSMVKLYKKSIDTAADCKIPNVVIHFLANYAAPDISDLGLARMDDVVEYAISKGVTIAFENLVRIGALAYAADRYEKIPNVRFCYDFGHAHCYPGYQNAPTTQVLDFMTDRVVTTHLHDNMGYTGTRDIKPQMRSLQTPSVKARDTDLRQPQAQVRLCSYIRPSCSLSSDNPLCRQREGGGSQALP